jgi:hypothetical protein
MVESLLAFKARLDTVLDQAFHKAEAFANTMKEAFESFINQRQNKPAGEFNQPTAHVINIASTDSIEHVDKLMCRFIHHALCKSNCKFCEGFSLNNSCVHTNPQCYCHSIAIPVIGPIRLD